MVRTTELTCLLATCLWSIHALRCVPPTATTFPVRVTPLASPPTLSKVVDKVLNDNKVELRQSGNNAVLQRLEAIASELVSDSVVRVPLPDGAASEQPEETDVFPLFEAALGGATAWSALPVDLARSYLDYKLYRALDGMRGSDSTSGSSSATPYDFALKAKFEDLKRCQAFAEEVATRLPDIVMEDNPYDALATFVGVCLWGQSTELPVISAAASVAMSAGSGRDSGGEAKKNGVAAKRRQFSDGLRAQQRLLLCDDTAAALDALKASVDARPDADVAVVLGNTGKELMGDLALAYVLLSLKLCATVTLHAKRYTTATYGATAVDVAGHISHLADAKNSDVWAVRHLGESLREHVFSGRLRVEEDAYWCLPPSVPYWEMSEGVAARVARSAMVFLKGDTNYRRLLGDCDCPLTADARSVAGYWPAPLCALRVLTSTAGCGVGEQAAARARKEDAKFMTSGEWGMVQFWPTAAAAEAQG